MRCAFGQHAELPILRKGESRKAEVLQRLRRTAGSVDRPFRIPEPRSYTPKHLAEKILTSRSALEGERKQVTVLFADVQGSMALAEQVDPEKWHGILDRFFQILSDGVHRFEGTVNQYTGDGIMALFGAPIAHEDHAQRACYAALHLKDELRRYAEELKRTRGLSFSVRMGLAAGASSQLSRRWRRFATFQRWFASAGHDEDPPEMQERLLRILADFCEQTGKLNSAMASFMRCR